MKPKIKEGLLMSTIYQVKTSSPEETRTFASRLVNYLKPSSVITLEGDLGAGKTVFAQGIAEGLDIKQVVNSPTFTIIKEYHGRLPLYHMDVYRLDSDSDEDLGFDEYFYGEGISIVEWASIIKDFLPEHYLEVKINKLGNELREIILYPHGSKFIEMCEEFFKHENFSD